MRQVLVDYARALGAAKRGGGGGRVQWDTNIEVEADGGSRQLKVLELHPDRAPDWISGYELPDICIGSLCSQVQALSINAANGYAFLADDHGHVRVFDVSNPRAPALRGQIGFFPAGIDVTNRRAFSSESGLRVFDISNPVLPVLLGQTTLSGSGFGQIDVVGHRVLVQVTGGIDIVDVSNPAAPNRLGTIVRQDYTVQDFVGHGNLFTSQPGRIWTSTTLSIQQIRFGQAFANVKPRCQHEGVGNAATDDELVDILCQTFQNRQLG